MAADEESRSVLNGYAASGAFEPVNGKIAFARGKNIHIINPDGTDEASITARGKSYGPVWSPDGTRIAFVSRVKGISELWVMDADGSNKVQVTTSGGVLPYAPAWSPDGLKLAYGGPCVVLPNDGSSCDGYDGYTVVNVVAATAPFGSPRTVRASWPSAGPMSVLDRVTWSPVGGLIAFHTDSYTGGSDEYVVTYEFSTGYEEVISSVGSGGYVGRIGNPAFGPDGDLLAWDKHTDAQGYIDHRGIQLCGYPTGRCDQFKQVADDSQLAFAPDQSRVVLVRQRIGDRLLLADMDGTDRDRLAKGTSPSWQHVSTS